MAIRGGDPIDLYILPKRGDFVFVDLTGVEEYAAFIDAPNNNNVTFSSLRRTAAGEVIPSQRVLRQEFFQVK